MIQKLFRYLFIIAVVTFVSCDKSIDIDDQDVMYLLIEAVHRSRNAETIENFEYDKQNRLIKMTRRFPSGETQSNEFVYDEWGNLVSLHYYENGVYRARHTLRFTKVGNRINVVSASWFFEPGSYSSYIILNEQGFAESQETTFQGDWSAKKKFLYHHENSNLIRMEEEDTYNDVYGGRNHTFTYDSYKSPFYYCETPKWVFTLFYREWWSFGINAIQNNITERNYPNPIEYEYLYNSSGLPFERIGGDTVTRYRYKNNIIKQ